MNTERHTCHVFHHLTWLLAPSWSCGTNSWPWKQVMLTAVVGPIHQTSLSGHMALRSWCLKAATQKEKHRSFNSSDIALSGTCIKVEYSHKLFQCLYQCISSSCLSLLISSSQHQFDKCLVGPFCANESFTAELLCFCLLSTGLHSRYMEICSFDAIMICFSGYLVWTIGRLFSPDFRINLPHS